MIQYQYSVFTNKPDDKKTHGILDLCPTRPKRYNPIYNSVDH